jgi:hypothetical protein
MPFFETIPFTCHDIVSNKAWSSLISHVMILFQTRAWGSLISHVMVLFQTKGMEFSNITCHGIVSNKGMEFSNITCHGIVSNKGMEFQYHMSWYCFKQGHVILENSMPLFETIP